MREVYRGVSEWHNKDLNETLYETTKPYQVRSAAQRALYMFNRYGRPATFKSQVSGMFEQFEYVDSYVEQVTEWKRI